MKVRYEKEIEGKYHLKTPGRKGSNEKRASTKERGPYGKCVCMQLKNKSTVSSDQSPERVELYRIQIRQKKFRQQEIRSEPDTLNPEPEIFKPKPKLKEN